MLFNILTFTGRLLAFRIRSNSLRSVAVSRLHGLSGLTVHSFANHGRSVLLGQDCCQVSSLENREQGTLPAASWDPG
jgi:hypothetical protein